MAKKKGVQWTMEDIENLHKQGKIQSFKVTSEPKQEPEKRNRAKYNNTKVEYEGIVFDSKKEYLRYRELLLLLKAGEIGFLELQVPYELNQGGTHSIKYIADFVYVDSKSGKRIVEDCKGFRTEVYKKKCRLMKKLHNISVLET